MLSVLSLPFMQQALLLGVIISLGAGLLSPFLVLNQHGMIAHGIAHSTFTGVVLGLLLFNDPLWIALPFAVLISLSIEYLSDKVKLHGDVSIGIVSSIAFAIGLIILNTTNSIQVSVESLLVGNIFISRPSDMWLSIIIVILIALFIYIFYKQLLIMTYDIVYATFLNLRVKLIKYLLAILTALLIVVGVRAIGVLLISALIIFPSAISSKISLTFKWTVILSMLLAVFASLFGILLAHPLNTPASAMIVVVYAVLFIISTIYSRLRGA
jgi:zinc transport system permease protein